MSNVNALARGLPALLELTTQGKGPGDLLSTIQSIIDIEPYVWLNKRERLQSGAAAAGTAAGDWSFGAPFVVGPTEAWLLYSYTVQAVIPIGLTARIAPTVQMAVTSGAPVFARHQLGVAQGNSVSVIASTASAYADRLPILLPPGSILGGVTTELSAATAFNAFGNVDFVRIRL